VHAKIIFLNGVGSVGKTSIAKALQDIMDEPYLHVGLDHFIDMIPKKYLGHIDGIRFVNVNKPEEAPTLAVVMGAVAQAAMRGMRAAMVALAEAGNNLIIDEVIFGDEFTEYRTMLAPFSVLYVGIFAPLDVIERRELARGDRSIGLARWQYPRVHAGADYDLEVDSSQLTAETCAELIKVACPWIRL